MKTIRFKNEPYLLVSVNDVVSFIQEKLKISDKKIGVIAWEFKKAMIKDLYNEYKRGSIFNMLLIPYHDDCFLSWTRFWRLEKFLNRKGYYVSEIFRLLSDPNEIELNPLFEEV